ncbi:MAG: hypothetical protein AAF790_05630 [Planctomycetota bacterium]
MPAIVAAETGAASTAGDLELLAGVSATQATPPAVQAAWQRLVAGGPDTMIRMLRAMDGASPAAQNWLRAGVDAVGEKCVGTARLPLDELGAFLADKTASPKARHAAFTWIVRVDPDAKPALLAGMLDDPSLMLRYDAVALQLEAANALTDADAQAASLEQLLKSARDPAQLEAIAKQLEELGREVDLGYQMGFLKRWWVIGPFDNTGLAHFDTPYGPEEEPEQKQDTAKTYQGKNGEVAWKEVDAQGDQGELDLTEHLGEQKEAVAYAYTRFCADDGACEIRYESRNATKVWVNGELVAANEVYHSGGTIDQYRAPVKLGQTNTILVKLCQNEQRMPWEREWGLRLRVVDATGGKAALQRVSKLPTDVEPTDVEPTDVEPTNETSDSEAATDDDSSDSDAQPGESEPDAGQQ